LKSDGRLPDEYFIFDGHAWGNGALFPKDAEILCNTNYGCEGVYLDILVRYEKDVYEYNQESETGAWEKRMVTESFATGKTLGDSIDDLDKMNLVASSVTAAFYGSKAEIFARYARVESGEEPRLYPLPHEETVAITAKPRPSLTDRLQEAVEKAKSQDAQNNAISHNGRKGKANQCQI